MNTSVTTSPAESVSADWLVVLISEADSRDGTVSALDAAMSGAISASAERGDFEAKPQTLLTFYQATGVAAENVVIAGTGPAGECDVRGVRHTLLAALRSCCQLDGQHVAVVLDDYLTDLFDANAVAELFGDCAVSAPTDADVYKAEKSRFAFSDATLVMSDAPEEADTAVEVGVVIGRACNLVKHLVNRTANDIYPESFTDHALKIAETLQLETLVLDEQQLKKERMGAMLAVAQGSERPPRMVRLTYRGAGDDPVLALVGKGVTFDSGGYSIKSSDGMIAMKADMAGAATVLGVISAAAQLQLPVNICAYMGLVENMINGSAYRPGDVLTARNGTTIEVHNTDAEGRLVLADVLAYAVDDGAGQIIDFATLTGACVVALGEEITGMFPNDAELAEDIEAAAAAAGEFVWEMPMHDHFAPLLKSSVADCKNVGPRWGGAVTAAKFLEKFTGNDVPWVHLDIAGPSWADSSNAWQDAGGTASPVRTIIELLRQM